MKFALLVLAEPNSTGERSALQFAETLVNSGHNLQRVFFYGQAVHAANKLQQLPQGEMSLQNRWQKLAEQHHAELIVCIAAALRRGLTDSREAERYSLDGHNLAEHFVLSGLGQLVEASITADRLVTFG